MRFTIILVTLASTSLARSLSIESRQNEVGTCQLVNKGPCGFVGDCVGTDGRTQCVSKLNRFMLRAMRNQALC